MTDVEPTNTMLLVVLPGSFIDNALVFSGDPEPIGLSCFVELSFVFYRLTIDFESAWTYKHLQ